ncbi:MAG TPA: hypothetical protein VNQ77_05925 [Frankiaceae bacterium]|nr:hypothetical protein [Frankiaceae bacterium]
MRKILLAAAAAGLLTASFAGTASASECIQWPNPLGWDQIEVCHQLPIDPQDIIELES